MALGFGQVWTVGGTVPYVVGGGLLRALPNLLTLPAGGPAAVARARWPGRCRRVLVVSAYLRSGPAATAG